MFDVIIIGSGPSGLTAAIYTTRANLKTLVIAGFKWGGQLQLTTEVENFPGFPEGILGPELMDKMRKQAERFGAVFIQADVPETDLSTMSGGPFTFLIEGTSYQSKSVLIATGADAKTIGIPGETKFLGKGVSYCATCDGAFFKNKQIIVVGGGDSAIEEACYLTHFARKVTIIHRRDSLRASQIMQKRARENPQISLLLNNCITEITGTMKVENVKIKDIKTNEEHEMNIDGVFVAIGHIPNTNMFKGIELDEHQYIRAQQGTMTNINGVFVSGDVEDGRYRQAVTAAGFGCMAALDLEKWLRINT